MSKILYHTFGYDMTLVIFYEIIKETPKTAMIQEIGSRRTNKEDGGFTGEVIANPTIRKEKNIFRAARRTDPKTGEEYYVSGLGYPHRPRYLYPWDGRPLFYNTLD